MAKSPYQILGIKPDATADEIRAAYRRLAVKYHPDRNGSRGSSPRVSKGSQARMAEINAARDALLTKDGKLKPAVTSSTIIFGFSGNGADQVRVGLSILDAFLSPQSAEKLNDGIADLLDKFGHDDPATRQLVEELRSQDSGLRNRRKKRRR